MKLVLVGLSALFLAGCVVGSKHPLKTEIVTFPRGGFVEVNGKRMGTEPVTITLPQNEKGQLTNRVEIRALPSDQHLHAKSKVFDLTNANYLVQVPSRVMLDLSDVPDSEKKVDLVWLEKEHKIQRKQAKARESRSKPTRPVGGY